MDLQMITDIANNLGIVGVAIFFVMLHRKDNNDSNIKRDKLIEELRQEVKNKDDKVLSLFVEVKDVIKDFKNALNKNTQTLEVLIERHEDDKEQVYKLTGSIEKLTDFYKLTHNND